MISLLFALVALAGKPTPAEPTDAEWAQIVAGQVVTRAAPELSPPGGYAWAEVKSTPDAIWAVLNEPKEAVAASKTVTGCERYIYEDFGGGKKKVGLHYTLSVAWTEVNYWMIRDVHEDEGWLTWTLDSSKPNDLVASTGYYVLREGRTPGTTLLMYNTRADTGRNVPQWISTFLTQRALKGFVEHVKRKAEGG